MMIRVLVVDDHGLVREGFRSILSQADDIEVVGESADGESALESVERLRPDVVVMDVNMPGIGGIEATRLIRRRFPSVQVVAVTAHSADPFPSQLHEAGALGFVSKGCDAGELKGAVRLAAQGRSFISGEVAQRLAQRSVSHKEEVSPIATLSPRELQVMTMIVQGVGNQDISERLHLSVKTVSTYRHRLYEKLGVRNDVELTHLALRHGLVESG